MSALLRQLSSEFSDDDDFFYVQEAIVNVPVVYFGLHSLIDLAHTRLNLQIFFEAAVQSNLTLEQLKNDLGEVWEEAEVNDLILKMVQGKLLIFFENDESFVIMNPAAKSLDRAIAPPVNENIFLGPLDAFTEDIHSNIGILRKQLQSERVKTKSFFSGNEDHSKLALLYYSGVTDMNFIQKMTDQIEKNKHIAIHNLQQLSRQMMEFPSWLMISKFNQTELPQEAAAFLKQGRAIVFIDRFPLALIFPGMFVDVFCLNNDRNFPLPLMLFLRTLRLFGIWLTMILPGLYVAFVSVNPEVLRIEMALSIAETRIGIPYPAFIEMMFILIILELTIEAAIRLPKNIGVTVTMVGGIILGQAVVQAKLVSSLLIIILAATTIANSTIVGMQQSLALRVSKYIVLVMAAVFGVLGILEGMVFICAYLASVETFGVPYIGLLKSKDGSKYG